MRKFLKITFTFFVLLTSVGVMGQWDNNSNNNIWGDDNNIWENNTNKFNIKIFEEKEESEVEISDVSIPDFVVPDSVKDVEKLSDIDDLDNEFGSKNLEFIKKMESLMDDYYEAAEKYYNDKNLDYKSEKEYYHKFFTKFMHHLNEWRIVNDIKFDDNDWQNVMTENKIKRDEYIGRLSDDQLLTEEELINMDIINTGIDYSLDPVILGFYMPSDLEDFAKGGTVSDLLEDVEYYALLYYQAVEEFYNDTGLSEEHKKQYQDNFRNKFMHWVNKWTDIEGETTSEIFSIVNDKHSKFFSELEAEDEDDLDLDLYRDIDEVETEDIIKQSWRWGFKESVRAIYEKYLGDTSNITEDEFKERISEAYVDVRRLQLGYSHFTDDQVIEVQRELYEDIFIEETSKDEASEEAKLDMAIEEMRDFMLENQHLEGAYDILNDDYLTTPFWIAVMKKYKELLEKYENLSFEMVRNIYEDYLIDTRNGFSKVLKSENYDGNCNNYKQARYFELDLMTILEANQKFFCSDIAYIRDQLDENNTEIVEVNKEDLIKNDKDMWEFVPIKINLKYDMPLEKYKKLYPYQFFHPSYKLKFNEDDDKFEKLRKFGITPDRAESFTKFFNNDFRNAESTDQIINDALGAVADFGEGMGNYIFDDSIITEDGLDVSGYAEYMVPGLGTLNFINDAISGGLNSIYVGIDNKLHKVKLLMRILLSEVRSHADYYVTYKFIEDSEKYASQNLGAAAARLNVWDTVASAWDSIFGEGEADDGMIMLRDFRDACVKDAGVGLVGQDKFKAFDFDYLPKGLKPVAVIGDNIVNLFMESIGRIEGEINEKGIKRHKIVFKHDNREYKEGVDFKWNNKCEVQSIKEKVKAISHCWACGIYDFFFNALSYAAFKIYDAVRLPLVGLLWVLFGIWIIYKVLKAFWKIDGGDPEKLNSDFWIKEVGGKFLRAALLAAIFVLPNTSHYSLPSIISKYAIEPAALISGAFSKTITDPQDVAECEYINDDNYDMLKQHMILSETTKDEFLCILEKMNKISAYHVGLGLLLLEDAERVAQAHGHIIPDIEKLLLGFAIIVMFFILIIYIPLLYIGVFIEIGLTLMFIPLMGIAWVFPETPYYEKMKQGLVTFISNILGLIMLSVIIVVCTSLIHTTTGLFQGGENIFYKAIQTGDTSLVYNALSYSNGRFVQIMVVVIICIKLIQNASTIANEFAGVDVPNKVAGMGLLKGAWGKFKQFKSSAKRNITKRRKK